jgi:nitroreductase
MKGAAATNTPANPFLRLVHDHRSVRSYHPEAEVPAEHEQAIVAAAQRASTSCNLQTYAFLSVKDAALRKRIAELAGGNTYVIEAGSLRSRAEELWELLDLPEKVFPRAMKASGIYEGRQLDASCCSPADTRSERGAADRTATDYGWLEHSARRISSTNPLDVRPLLRSVLERAGFGFE